MSPSCHASAQGLRDDGDEGMDLPAFANLMLAAPKQRVTGGQLGGGRHALERYCR